MSFGVTIDELMVYSDHERLKWRSWFAADPRRLALPFQPGGRFPTVGTLVDHIFLVERRHLSRLQGSTPPEASGVAGGDPEALFDYADLVRADFRAYVAALSDPNEIMTLKLPMGTYQSSRRKLAVHVLLHEMRHFAQIAFAARVAGHEPPGDHDILFYGGLP